MSVTKSIDHVVAIARSCFVAEYLCPGRPVVVSREISQWGPPSQWNPEYLVARLGDKPVNVAIGSSGVFHCQPGNPKSFHVVKLSFREATAAICSHSETNGIYLMQQPIRENFPELVEDLRTPDLLGDEKAAVHLWFGTARNVTPLHYDPISNFFLQLHGRKRFTLFGPQYFEEMYPLPPAVSFSHISPVDAEQPDLAHYPRFSEAHRYEVVLQPGDLLFLPPFWWHHVRSLDLSISLSFWSAPRIAHCLVPAGLRLLSTVYERDRLATMGQPFRSASGDFLAPAREVRALGMRWPAVLLAGAAVEQRLRRLCRVYGILERKPSGLIPLAVINQQLAAIGTYFTERAATIARLDLAFERARCASDDLFTDNEVAEILGTVEVLLT